MGNISSRDKYIIIVIIAICLGYCLWTYAISPLNTSISDINKETVDVKDKIVDTASLETQLRELTETNDRLNKKVTDVDNGIKQDKVISKQEFALFLTNKCSENTIEVKRFDDLGTNNSGPDGNWRSTYDFELRATHENLLKLCDEIDALGVNYNITSISLRQNLELPWTKRASDDTTKLPWYIDGKKEETSDTDTNVVEANGTNVSSSVNNGNTPVQQVPVENKPVENTSQAQPAPVEEKPVEQSVPVEQQQEQQQSVQEHVDNNVNSSTNSKPSIGDRLNSLLGISESEKVNSVFRGKKVVESRYEVGALSSAEVQDKTLSNNVSSYYDGTMLLNLTIEFVMKRDPSSGNALTNIGIGGNDTDIANRGIYGGISVNENTNDVSDTPDIYRSADNIESVEDNSNTMR